MILEIIGWAGSILYILSYFLLSYNIIKREKLYYLLNKIAALLIIIISVYKETYQSVIVNLIWLYISYLGYINKTLTFKFFTENIMHMISILFLSASFLIICFFNYFLFIEVLAWFSVFAFSSAYFLFSVKEIKEKMFHLYNFIAALSLIPKMIEFENYQVLILEILWAFFALSAYIKNNSDKDYLTVSS